MADHPPPTAMSDEEFNDEQEQELGEEPDEDHEPPSDEDGSDEVDSGEEDSEEESLGDGGSDDEYEDLESEDDEKDEENEDESEDNDEDTDEDTDESTDDDDGRDDFDETGSVQSESSYTSMVSVREIATPGGRFNLPLPPPSIINNIRFAYRLLSLAAELRVMVLREYLVSPADISLSNTDHGRILSKLPTLMACESTFVYLSENTFNLGLIKAGIREQTFSIVNQTDQVDSPIFPVRWINHISLMFSILINHPAPAPGVFIIDPHFFRLELHRLTRGRGLQLSLTTIPRFHGGPPEESCVCKLEKFANALYEVHVQPVGIVPPILDVMYWAIPKATDSKCEKCGKRLLCMVNLKHLETLQRWMVSFEKFMKCIKEMKEKIARGG